MLNWLKKFFKRKPKVTITEIPAETPRLDTPLVGSIEETLKSHSNIVKYCVICGMDKDHNIVADGFQCKTCGYVKPRRKKSYRKSIKETQPEPSDVSKFFKGKGSKNTLKSYRKSIKEQKAPEED